jgi:hypothetical protein
LLPVGPGLAHHDLRDVDTHLRHRLLCSDERVLRFFTASLSPSVNISRFEILRNGMQNVLRPASATEVQAEGVIPASREVSRAPDQVAGTAIPGRVSRPDTVSSVPAPDRLLSPGGSGFLPGGVVLSGVASNSRSLPAGATALPAAALSLSEDAHGPPAHVRAETAMGPWPRGTHVHPTLSVAAASGAHPAPGATRELAWMAMCPPNTSMDAWATTLVQQIDPDGTLFDTFFEPAYILDAVEKLFLQGPVRNNCSGIPSFVETLMS